MTTAELQEKIRSLLPGHEEMGHFTANRQRDQDKRYIPTYHFASPGGYLNDPNGYCYHKGVYHLFYQFISEHTRDLAWGHAVSVDLIHWLDLPRAITCTIEEWAGSGNILFEEGRAIACYPGNLRGKKGNDIHLAVSTDDLLINWKRLTPLPVITSLDENGQKKPYIAYDPFLWKKDDTYYLISAGGGALPTFADPENNDVRREFLFTSKDLEHWEYHHDILEDDRFCQVGDDGGCPYLYPFGKDRHLLLHFSHRSGGQYLIGRYDEDAMKFQVKNGGAFNSQSWLAGGVHAPSAFPGENGDIHAIFNVNYCLNAGPENQIMSLPRVMRPGPRDTLLETPDGDYASLRYGHTAARDLRLTANKETVLEAVSGSALELQITADVAEKTGGDAFIAENMLPLFEVRVLRSPDAEEYTAIRFYRNRSKIDWHYMNVSETAPWSGAAESVVEVDTSHATLKNVAIHPTEAQRLYLRPDEPVNLHIFVDKSIVEVFANDRRCVAVRTYPTREDSVGVSLRSAGVDTVVSYEAWKMKSIYE